MSDKKDLQELSKKVSEDFTEMAKNFVGRMGREDSTDLATIAYLRAYGCELREEGRVYKDGEHVGDLSHAMYNGKKLDIKVKWLEPVHFIKCNIDIEKIKSKG